VPAAIFALLPLQLLFGLALCQLGEHAPDRLVGRLEVSDRIAAAIRRRDRVVFVVEDDGVGIPPDKIERVFERLTKLRPRGTAGERGTGIGLFVEAALDAQNQPTVVYYDREHGDLVGNGSPVVAPLTRVADAQPFAADQAAEQVRAAAGEVLGRA